MKTDEKLKKNQEKMSEMTKKRKGFFFYKNLKTCAKNMLDGLCDPTEHTAVVKTGHECLLGNYMSTHGNLCYESLLRPNAVQGQVSLSVGAKLVTCRFFDRVYSLSRTHPKGIGPSSWVKKSHS